MPRCSRSRKYSSLTLKRTSSLTFSFGGRFDRTLCPELGDHLGRRLEVVADQEARAAGGQLDRLEPALHVGAGSRIHEALAQAAQRVDVARLHLGGHLLDDLLDVGIRSRHELGDPQAREEHRLQLGVRLEHRADVVLGPVVRQVPAGDEHQVTRLEPAQQRRAAQRGQRIDRHVRQAALHVGPQEEPRRRQPEDVRHELEGAREVHRRVREIDLVLLVEPRFLVGLDPQREDGRPGLLEDLADEQVLDRGGRGP